MHSVRTRFAPSPTGYLHIGGARTALFSWLYARKTQGRFILRIEDTDLARSTPESVRAILDGIAWLGLDYDEGPFYQTQHFNRYEEVINLLLKEDKAYRCYCSKERLETLRASQLEKKEKPRYDGHCRNLTEIQNNSFVIRFKNPMEGMVTFHDLVRGDLVFANSELDDLIISRTDGSPTYNFTVVVDDWDMKITHVIRGDDHINNTPRQINILKALNAGIPQYAHVPMILGNDGKRLSKRHGAVSVLQYREEGYLPEALVNYLVRLGWSRGDQEIFTISELIGYFELTDINRSPAAFNPEKLLWVNQYYIKNLSIARVAQELAWHMQRLGIDIAHGPTLGEIVLAQRERAKTLLEMAERSRYFYEDFELAEEMKTYFTDELKPILRFFTTKMTNLAIWEKEPIHEILKQTAEEYSLKLGKIAQPIRVAVTGSTISPPLDITLMLLGKKKTVERLHTVVGSDL